MLFTPPGSAGSERAGGGLGGLHRLWPQAGFLPGRNAALTLGKENQTGGAKGPSIPLPSPRSLTWGLPLGPCEASSPADRDLFRSRERTEARAEVPCGSLGKFGHCYSVPSWEKGNRSSWESGRAERSLVSREGHSGAAQGTSGCWDLAVPALLGLAHHESSESGGVDPLRGSGRLLFLLGPGWRCVSSGWTSHSFAAQECNANPTPGWRRSGRGCRRFTRACLLGMGCTRQAGPPGGHVLDRQPRNQSSNFALGRGDLVKGMLCVCACDLARDFRPRRMAVSFRGLWLTQRFSHREGGTAVENRPGAWMTRPSACLRERLAAKPG